MESPIYPFQYYKTKHHNQEGILNQIYDPKIEDFDHSNMSNLYTQWKNNTIHIFFRD
jgi:hypothetical protein